MSAEKGEMISADALMLYRKLADGLADMVEGGRLTKASIPDDYEWLVKVLAEIVGWDWNPREWEPLQCPNGEQHEQRRSEGVDIPLGQ